MTKKQESPYQISLDIPPFPPLQRPDEANVASSNASPSPTPELPDLDNEQGLKLDPNHCLVPTIPPPLHATQISLLDELPSSQSEPAMSVGSSLSIRSEEDDTFSVNTELRPVQSAIATPAQSPILEPYLLSVGTIIPSPGGHFNYRILGACCRLFDRDELPWPCCRIQWRSKEPSWRRIGKRFVPDLATKRFPSYMVEIIDHEYSREPFILTLYWLKFPPDVQDWWYTRYVPRAAQTLNP